VLAALGLFAIPSQIWPTDGSAQSVILLIGLAVGVDYSLFYLKREREERANGLRPGAALEAAAATSGRSVLISGVGVLIAMAGLFLTDNEGFSSIAAGTILVVAIAMIGSLTVLPAVLSKLGERVENGRLPLLRARARGGEGRFWSAIVDRVLRHPVIAATLAAGVLVAMAIPAFAIRTVLPGYDSLPKDFPIANTYRR
jgi:putative drug exporter of the RND superfamily